MAGRAFQVVDDLLDLDSDEETLGKTPGKDVKEGKLTYPAVVGIDASRAEARRLVEAAKTGLREATGGEGSSRLCRALDFIVERVG